MPAEAAYISIDFFKMFILKIILVNDTRLLPDSSKYIIFRGAMPPYTPRYMNWKLFIKIPVVLHSDNHDGLGFLAQECKK